MAVVKVKKKLGTNEKSLEKTVKQFNFPVNVAKFLGKRFFT